MVWYGKFRRQYVRVASYISKHTHNKKIQKFFKNTWTSTSSGCDDAWSGIPFSSSTIVPSSSWKKEDELSVVNYCGRKSVKNLVISKSSNLMDTKSTNSSLSRQESEESRSSNDTGSKRKWMSTLKSKLSTAENEIGAFSDVSSFEETSQCGSSALPERK